jgi:CMP-N-acetylneuraminic acid synthetase
MKVCIIPARKGSKSVVDKNIRDFHGYPLFVHSIFQAKGCSLIDRVFVSTDSELYAGMALEHGAEVILRPESISHDLSRDDEVFAHALAYMRETLQMENIEVIIHFRPTYPIRSEALVEDAIRTFCEKRDVYDSLRTVVRAKECPFKMYAIHSEQTPHTTLYPLFPTFGFLNEPYNHPRQAFPEVYIHNGCIDIFNVEMFMRRRSVTGNKIYPYIMVEENIDIDTEQDLERAISIYQT